MSTEDSPIRTIPTVIAVLLLLSVLMVAFMVPMMGLWSWGHVGEGAMWNGMGGTWMWLLTSIVPVLLILGVGYLLYNGLRQSARERTDPAMEELRTAYARGEVSDEEFERRRDRLQRER